MTIPTTVPELAVLSFGAACFLHTVVSTFETLDKILHCDYSNESYKVVLSCGAVYCAVQGGSNFEPVDEIL